jgi:methionyl aminopeptidase
MAIRAACISIGDVPIKARRLVDVTYECLMLGIEQAKPGNIWAMSVTRSRRTPRSTATAWCAISAGMAWAACSTTHPKSSMSAGPARAGAAPRHDLHDRADDQYRPPDVKLLDDGWTAVTRDRTLSAQFEHSIGITQNGCEIFTKSAKGLDRPHY